MKHDMIESAVDSLVEVGELDETLTPITDLGDLRYRAQRDPRYAELAKKAAANLGGRASSVEDALRTLEINAMETGSEEGVVDEVNFVLDLVKEGLPDLPDSFVYTGSQTDEQIEAAIDHMLEKTVTIKGKGKKPIKFKAGGLHKSLDVPAGKPIPPGKKAAALRGEYGKKAKKQATLAFKGALAKGRQTAAG